MRYEDRIYHSGYLDGYYASMELYHSDDSEMTEEEKAKRRKRRNRKIALGVGIPVGVASGLLGGTYLYNEAKYNKELEKDVKAWRAAKKAANNNVNGARYKGAESFKAANKPKRNIHGFRRNVSGSYKVPNTGGFSSWRRLNIMRDEKIGKHR